MSILHVDLECREPSRSPTPPLPPPRDPQRQTHLGPYGFSDEEILKLLGWQYKNKSPKKQKPSLDVEAEGGEDVAGQAKKPDNGGDRTTGNVEKVENGAIGTGGKPKVEVDQGSGKRKHYRGR